MTVNDQQKESEKMVEMNLAMNLDSYDHNLITIDQLATKANQKRGKARRGNSIFA